MAEVKFTSEVYERVLTLIDSMKEPVSLPVLEWEVTYAEGSEAYSGLDGNQKTRRSNLYMVVRDLIYEHVLESTLNGIEIRQPLVPIEDAIGNLASRGLIAA